MAVETRLVTIFFGANDASLVESNPRQHVPLDEYKANLRAIVEHIQAACPAALVIVLTPPPIDEFALSSGRLAGSRTNANAGLYAVGAAEVAAELGAPSINLWEEMQQDAGGKVAGEQTAAMKAGTAPPPWAGLLCDGLHLSSEGNELVAALLLKTVAAASPGLAVAGCPYSRSTGNSGSASELPVNAPWHDAVTDPEGFKAVLSATPAFRSS